MKHQRHGKILCVLICSYHDHDIFSRTILFFFHEQYLVFNQKTSDGNWASTWPAPSNHSLNLLSFKLF